MVRSRQRAQWLVATGRAAAVLAAVLLLLAPHARALDSTRDVNQYLVDFWQDGGGLPHNHVFTAIQTRDGYIWVGTRGGLARFDGVRFTVYDDRQGQLPEVEVWALAEDRDGALWIGTYGGGLTRLQSGTFTSFSDGLPSQFVTTLLATPDAGVFIGTMEGLAYIENERITSYRGHAGIPHRYVSGLHRDGTGTLWIATGGGPATFAKGAFEDLAVRYPALKTPVVSIADDSRGGVWLGTRGTGLIHLGADRRITRFMRKDGLPSDTVICVHVDPHGIPWIGTEAGVVRYREGRFEHLFTEIVNPGATRTLRTVSVRGVRLIFSDREQNVWMGPENDGLLRLRDAPFATVAVNEDPGAEQRVTSVFEDREGVLWAGIVGGLKREKGGTLQSEPVTTSATAFAQQPDGTLWIGTNTGVSRWTAGKLEPALLPGVTIIALVASPESGLWIGTRGDGVYRHAGGQLTHFTPADGLPGVQVRALAQDSRGGIWIGTKDQGLARWRSGAFRLYSEKNGLTSSSISAVYVDRDDVVWVGTRRGLNRIRAETVTGYTTENGLPANFVYQIIEDDHGALWLTYSGGVMRILKRDLDAFAEGRLSAVHCEAFGVESGLRSTSMTIPNQPAAWKRRDGRLWFGSARGLAVVDPASIVQNTLPPPVQIEEVVVDRQSHRPETAAVFPPGRGDLEFHYTGLSFVAPKHVRFQYRLEGFDKDWIDAGNRRVAYYTQVPPGQFRFQVKACNNDGVWNEAGASLSFELRPHWYQRRGVHIAGLVLVALLLVAADRFRIEQHRRQARRLREAVDAAVSQIKMLRGMLPICPSCKKIRDDSGYWSQMETYVQAHSEADFTHSVCPECMKRLYPDYARTLAGS